MMKEVAGMKWGVSVVKGGKNTCGVGEQRRSNTGVLQNHSFRI